MQNLKNYRRFVSNSIINEIYKKAKKFSKKHIVCISSTHQGGGVAEMLNGIVFLFNEIDIDFGWRIIHGAPDFFNITKDFHNALQGAKMNLSKRKKEIYEETNRRFSIFAHLNHDLVIIHDPQPLALIKFSKRKQPWIFRCHIDISNPNKVVWNYLKQFIKKYDHFVVSADIYKKNLPVPQSIIHPAIDPLSAKNTPMSKKRILKYLHRNGIDIEKPIISQISRYDRWKDPEGVIKIFKRVRKKIDCQLVLLGNIAPDNTEGTEVYNRIVNRYGGEKDITILVNVNDNDLVVNALQTASKVVIQKSTKEGFGLTVSEALYKSTPVVASNIGGIPLQIINGFNGFLHEPNDYDSFAQSIIKILENNDLRSHLGQNAREYVKQNFLITRLMLDWLNLFEKYINS